MRVLENTAISDTLFKLTLDPEGQASSFQLPGQYVVINLENQKPLYLVIGSTVGASKWSFLIRDANASTKILKDLIPGNQIDVSMAQGKGYPLEKLIGKNIILFSAGTGLASYYSVMGKVLENRKEYKKIFLLHGSRFESELFFKEEMLDWVRNEVEVFVTLSKPSETWAFYEGHVYDILKHEKLDLTNFSALICGPGKMVKDVTEIAGGFGLKSENILTNY